MATNTITIADNLCPATEFLKLFKGKWTVVILSEIQAGNNHYGKLMAHIPDINSRSLAIRLRELESLDIITRNVISEKPLQVAYDLTNKGSKLKVVFDNMKDWYNQFQL
ncbi:helix-turn-helix transcriptional regulator [Leuconostoc gelidum subsp. gasicomitatum]|uniref:winged helix-turn-helix transcriptional regulator n=1 Tax=Leuconostoc gasicomitatum TaxID=115778 RepID=UPI001CC7E5A7|nr:helix-turn-helix domain-containing protein [Leuconostoc gasicomitatum]MBZ5984623.1 helix-turn-helix transcriptional regulator [Leuconostoc gasicomitatum]